MLLVKFSVFAEELHGAVVSLEYLDLHPHSSPGKPALNLSAPSKKTSSTFPHDNLHNAEKHIYTEQFVSLRAAGVTLTVHSAFST